MSKLKVNELDTRSGTTITVAAGKTIAGTDIIDTAQIAADAVDTSEIAANAVTLAEMAGLARGKLIVGDASGDPSALTVGTSGQYLTSDGTDASWGEVTSLPTQTSNAGKYLVTDGTNASWDRESPNILINGDFDVWQRDTTFNLSSATNIYTADRWRFEGNNFTGSLIRYGFTSGQTDVPDGPGYYARWINNTSANAQQYTQRIETTPPHKLSGQTVMMSVWLKSASGTIADGNLTWVGGGGNIGAITTTWAKFTKTWAVPTQSGSYYTVGFQVPATETLLGGVDIAHVQLEFGSVATTFKSLTFAQELQACQRYYEKSYNVGTDPGSATATGAWFWRWPAAGAGTNTVYFKVEKRADPTMVSYSRHAGTSGKVTNMSGGASDIATNTVNIGENSVGWNWTSTGSETYVEGHWTAEAEL